jgi:hypothetical protein
MQDIKSSYIYQQVKIYDYDRYISGLFATEEQRHKLFSFYAFNIELDNILLSTSEEITSLIRLAWWREATSDIYQGKIRHHEVIKPLADLINQLDIKQDIIEEIINSRELDASRTRPKNIEQYLNYIDHSIGNLTKLSLLAINSNIDEKLSMLLARSYAITQHLFLAKKNLLPQVEVKELVNLVEDYQQQIYVQRKLITRNDLPIFLLTHIINSKIKIIKKNNYDIEAKPLKYDRFLMLLKLLFKASF